MKDILINVATEALTKIKQYTSKLDVIVANAQGGALAFLSEAKKYEQIISSINKVINLLNVSSLQDAKNISDQMVTIVDSIRKELNKIDNYLKANIESVLPEKANTFFREASDYFEETIDKNRVSYASHTEIIPYGDSSIYVVNYHVVKNKEYTFVFPLSIAYDTKMGVWGDIFTIVLVNKGYDISNFPYERKQSNIFNTDMSFDKAREIFDSALSLEPSFINRKALPKMTVFKAIKIDSISQNSIDSAMSTTGCSKFEYYKNNKSLYPNQFIVWFPPEEELNSKEAMKSAMIFMSKAVGSLSQTFAPAVKSIFEDSKGNVAVKLCYAKNTLSRFIKMG